MDIQVGHKYLTSTGRIAEIVSIDPSLTWPIVALVYGESNRANAEVAQFELTHLKSTSDQIGVLWDLYEEPRVIWVRDDSVDFAGYGNILTTEPSCVTDGTNQLKPAGLPRWRKYQEVR